MDAGTGAKNNRRYISITAIYELLGPQICAALPGFHAFTGSDYTAAFVRKGKVKPFAKLEKNKEAQKAFQSLATKTELSQKNSKDPANFHHNHVWCKGHQQGDTQWLSVQGV